MSLEELYISHNQIQVIEGLENCVKLRVLDLSNNKISELQGLDSLNDLEELWVLYSLFIALLGHLNNYTS